MKKLTLSLLFLLSFATVFAQEEQDETDFSLEDLMNAKVSVTGAKETTLRESPGIVTVITQKEIYNSGARDLVDILRLIPGFEITGEIDNTITIGVRGNFAEEGKALFMIDGLEMNEIGYGTFMIGNRVLPDQIEKIEIIRGPGSAVYGGMAELAVINIITKKGSTMRGGYGSVQYGYSNGATSRYNAQMGFGDKPNQDLEYSFNTYYSTANRSNESYFYDSNPFGTEGNSATFNYADSSVTKTLNFGGNLAYKDFKLKALFQEYQIENNEGNGDWFLEGGIYLAASYKFDVSDKLSITPELSWKKENPWTYRGNISDFAYDTWVADGYRSKAKTTANWEITDKLNLTFGGEFREDKLIKPGDAEPFLNGTNEVSYTNAGGFAELSMRESWGNVTLGSRYDYHSKFGGAFVPRIAYTKAWQKVHMKALVSGAYKAPVIYNFELNSSIKPEFTTTAELEGGMLVNSKLSVTANVFYIRIKDPIVYNYDLATNAEAYFNRKRASTKGFEVDGRYKSDWGYLNLSYSFYQNNNSKVDAYEVETNNNLLRAFPAHKIVLHSAISAGSKLTFAPSIVYTSNRVGYFARSAFYEDADYWNYGSDLIANLNVIYQVNFKFDINLTGYDLFNNKFISANAYDAEDPGVPLMGREFALKARYKF